jgi:hypothetical protein
MADATDWPTIRAADERSHAPGPQPLWGESWYFDFFAPDGAYGGWVRAGLYPNLGVTWYHAFLVGRGRPTIAVAEYEAPLPVPGSLELRAHGLWADHICETPLDHWTLGNEAYALGVDDPADLYTAVPIGDHVPVSFDLEWETAGDAYHYVHTTRYEVPCTVHGEVAVGDERLTLDGFGQRDHSWSVRDWWQFDWCWTAGRLEDGTRFHGSDIRIPGVDVGFGYEQSAHGRTATNSVNAHETLGPHGFPTEAAIAIGDLDLTIEPIAFAPAYLQHEGRVTRFPRALCGFTAADGRTGFGWTEWNQVQRQDP